MGIPDKISEIQAEIARTQKNKATEHHIGGLKAKLAKYRAMLNNAPAASTSNEKAFEVQKTGDCRVALIGFPSVGKSTLLSKITKTFSKQSEVEFTTLDCIAGILEHKGAKIQLLDLPGIIDGASANKGRGRQVISIARTADLIVMMLDPRRKTVEQNRSDDKDNIDNSSNTVSADRSILERELNAMGIRLNRKRPDITLTKTGTGRDITIACKLTKIDEATIHSILKEYKIHNCQLTIREDISDEDLIDVLSGQGVYVPCIFLYNKIDELSLPEFLALAGDSSAKSDGVTTMISCNKDWNIDGLKEDIWEMLELRRIYTKKRGEDPKFAEPMVLRKSACVKELCRSIHKDFENNLKYAFVWGRSAKHSPQKVGLNHVLSDEDVVQLVSK
ncbi:uncharacterized protein ENBRE01_2902 [Enteropsectra breve]|nr:uncharacterized protein ENBRE01_2902 [Enteropsectra breve]